MYVLPSTRRMDGAALASTGGFCPEINIHTRLIIVVVVVVAAAICVPVAASAWMSVWTEAALSAALSDMTTLAEVVVVVASVPTYALWFSRLPSVSLVLISFSASLADCGDEGADATMLVSQAATQAQGDSSLPPANRAKVLPAGTPHWSRVRCMHPS